MLCLSLERGPASEKSRHGTQHSEHLRLLSIFHYILAGLDAFTGCIPLFHVSIGIAMLSGAFDNGRGPPPPPIVGLLFTLVGGSISLLCWTMAVLKVLAGRWLTQHAHPRFCFVVACIECLKMPMGTLLGIFTILVLMRPSVKALFAGEPPYDPRLDEFDDDDGETDSLDAPSGKPASDGIREGAG